MLIKGSHRWSYAFVNSSDVFVIVLCENKCFNVYLYNQRNRFLIPFIFTRNMIVVTGFIFIMKRPDYYLVHNRRENCHYHIPSNLKRIINPFLLSDIMQSGMLQHFWTINYWNVVEDFSVYDAQLYDMIIGKVMPSNGSLSDNLWKESQSPGLSCDQSAACNWLVIMSRDQSLPANWLLSP